MKRNQWLGLLFIIISSSRLLGQQPAFQTPTINPPSPTAQAFMRYGEIPVDYSTGVPNIEIPIFTLEGKKLKIPISISYHASGIKVNDVASEVGLGWVLNAGGIISRTVFGVRDEKINPPRYFNSAQQLLDSLNAVGSYFDNSSRCYPKIRAFEEMMLGSFINEDPINDRFFYKLPIGTSGVFRYSHLSDSVILMPYRPLKIQRTITDITYDPKISEIIITDENGTVHTFKLFFSDYSTSEWYLTEMISADFTDTIKFEYEVPTHVNSFANRTEIYNESIGGIIFGETCTPYLESSHFLEYSGGNIHVNTPLLKRIVSSKSVMNFNYGDRLDDFGGYLKLKKLTNITISQKGSSEALKNLNFNHEYFGNSTDKNRRLCLESYVINDPGMTQSEKYTFKYYKTKVLPPYSYYATSSSEDFWGYYNGSNSPNLIPADFVIDINKPSCGNRNPDATGTYAQACMLEEIKYPTGGRTVFQFDRHFASNVFSYKKFPESKEGYVGGFRVKSITSYNELNEVVGIKTYEYEEMCYKPLLKSHFFQTHNYMVEVHCDIGSWGSGGVSFVPYSRDKVYSDPITSIEVSPGLPVVYLKITEYNGTKTNNSGKTIYKYSSPYSPAGDNIEYHPYHFDKGNYLPLMLAKTNYSFNGTNYLPVSKTTFRYDNLFGKRFFTGINVTRHVFYSTQGWLDLIPSFCLGLEVNEYIQSFTAINTEAYQEALLLTQQNDYIFDPRDSTKFLLTTTNYAYNERNLQVMEKSVLTSNNELLKTSFKYPVDFCSSNNVYCKMVDRNIITPVIEQIETVNSKPLSAVKTNYSYWKNDVVNTTKCHLVIDSDLQNIANSSFTFSKDAQLIVSLHLEMCTGFFTLNIDGPTKIDRYYNGPSTCGDYFSLNPQEIFNLAPGNYSIYLSYQTGSPDAGFYGTLTGIMSESKPGCSISSLPTEKIYPSSVDAKTGSFPYETRLNYHNYDIKGNIMTFSKANDTKEIYIWSYNALYPVAKLVTNIDYADIETLLGGPSAVKNFILKSSPTLNEIKTFLLPLADNKNVMIKIFTHKPLIGITSETDPNGVTTYYEYDGFGRLKYVKDDDGNILKSHEYHYKE